MEESEPETKTFASEVREFVLAVLFLPFLPLAVFYPIFLAFMYLLPVLCLLGFFFLWNLPAVADRHHVRQFDVALRIVSASQRDPLHFLGDMHDLAPGRLQNPSADEVNRIEERLAGAYPGRRPELPALGAPLTEFDQLRNFGFRLHGDWLVRAERDAAGNVPAMNVLWFVWLRVESNNPFLARDFDRLPELFALQPPETRDWARESYRRLRLKRQLFNEWTKSKIDEPILPPESNMTLAWYAYQMIGLNEDSRAFAQERWRGKFTATHRSAVIQWGQTLETERRGQGEPLPPTSEANAFLCVVERLLGLDGYGERSLRAIPDLVKGRLLWATFDAPTSGTMTALGVSMRGAYPNSEFHNLAASGDPFHQFPGSTFPRQDWKIPKVGRIQFGPYRIPAIATYVGLQLLLAVAFSISVFHGIAPLLDIDKHPYYSDYAKSQKLFSMQKLILSYGIVPIGSWLFGWYRGAIDVPVDYLMQSPFHKLFAIYVSMIAGGILINFLKRLVALCLISMGHNLKHTFWDEIVGGLIGGVILFHFGSSPIAIGRSMVFSFLPDIIYRWRHRGDPPPAELPPQWKGKFWEVLLVFGIVIGIACCIGVWLLQRLDQSQ